MKRVTFPLYKMNPRTGAKTREGGVYFTAPSRKKAIAKGKAYARRKNIGVLGPDGKLKRRRRKKNVEMGYHDATGFHPIRASKDYAPYRSGEFPKQGRSSRQRAAASRRAKGRMHASRARRGGRVS